MTDPAQSCGRFVDRDSLDCGHKRDILDVELVEANKILRSTSIQSCVAHYLDNRSDPIPQPDDPAL